jgi:hypothetical protein
VGVERVAGRGDVGLEDTAVGVGEFEEVIGRTELGVARHRRGCVRRQREADRRGDTRSEQRQDEHLLAPLAPEQPPGPPDDRASGGAPPRRCHNAA